MWRVAKCQSQEGDAMKIVTTLVLSAMLATPAIADEGLFMNCHSYQPQVSDYPLAIHMNTKSANGKPAGFRPLEITWRGGNQNARTNNFLNRLTGAYQQTTPDGAS